MLCKCHLWVVLQFNDFIEWHHIGYSRWLGMSVYICLHLWKFTTWKFICGGLPVLANSSRSLGRETGKAKQPIMVELSSRFPLWIIGTFFHWAPLGASVEHVLRVILATGGGNWYVYGPPPYQFLVEGGINCLVLPPPQIGLRELRECPQAKRSRSWQLAVGQHITTMVRLEGLCSACGLRLLCSTNTGILLLKITGEAPVKFKNWLKQN